jgi:RHS repeat-associated protein
MAETGAGSVSYQYDLLGHLTQVTRSAGESESLFYGPGGELVGRQIGERFVFYVGEYATVTASGMPGCGAGCIPLASTVEVDSHVVFAGTRIASVKPSRTLYYYRTRLGTVIATSLGGGLPGAGYRYTPYGEVELAVNETEATRSELGYTNALRLTRSLLHLKNRVYDAEGRVFLQADTVDRLRYAYVWGDPVNLSDPTGLLAAFDSMNPMNPVQRFIADAMAWWSREWFSEGQRETEASEQQTKKETRKEDATALQNEEAGDAESQRQNEGLLSEVDAAWTNATTAEKVEMVATGVGMASQVIPYAGDYVSLGASTTALIANPSWSNLGNVGLDAVGAALPLVPALGTIKRAEKIGEAVSDAQKLRKEFDTVRTAFWKSEAAVNGGKYSAENLARMKLGKPPIAKDGFPLEIHHKRKLSEGGTNSLDNLQPMTRTDHRLGNNYARNHEKQP